MLPSAPTLTLPLFTSSPIDLTIETETKRRILSKVTKDLRGELIDVLIRLSKRPKQKTWAIGKQVDGFLRKNAFFVPYLPGKIDHHLDYGSGSGVDALAIAQCLSVGRTICADVKNQLLPEAKGFEFVKVQEGRGLEIPDSSVDLVTIFHTIHHLNEGVDFRLRDIGRKIKRGGLLFVKDHDVRTKEQASNVDFEHLAYSVLEREETVERLMADFNVFEPMWFYSSDQVRRTMERLGFTHLGTALLSERNRSYSSVFQRR